MHSAPERLNIMGKGNRSRQDRALETVAVTEETYTKNIKRTTRIVTIIVALFLIACIALTTVVNTGILVRLSNVAKTKNYSVNGSILSYLIYSQAQQLAYNYQQYGLDTTVEDILATSYGPAEEGKTYFDYFAESSLASIKQMLILCEYADANGIKLSEDDIKDIDENIAALEEAAASNYYSTSQYIKLMYGPGVSKNDVRTALELSALSSAAYEKLEETLDSQVTDEKMKEYIEKNVASFYTADYLSYTFTAELEAAGAEATDEEKAAYEADKTAMTELATKLAGAKTEEEFKQIVRDYLVNTNASELFDTAYVEDYLGEDESKKPEDAPADDVLAADKAEILKKLDAYLLSLDSDEEAEEEKEEEETEEKTEYRKALDKIYEEIKTDAEKVYSSLLVEDVPHYDPETAEEDIEELDKWLFDDATKANDTKQITSEGDKKSTYTVYFLKNASHLNEEETENVAHLLVKFESDKPSDSEKAAAKAEAEKHLADFLAGGDTSKDAFEKFAKELTDDSGVIYENVRLGKMVEPFEDWLFDETRKEGDTGIVETEFGYHVMYYISQGELVWENDARNGVIGELFEAWIEAEAVTYGYSANEKALGVIN